MCVQPTILAPAKGFSPCALFLKAISAGISEKSRYIHSNIREEGVRDKEQTEKLVLLRQDPLLSRFPGRLGISRDQDIKPDFSFIRSFQRQVLQCSDSLYPSSPVSRFFPFSLYRGSL